MSLLGFYQLREAGAGLVSRVVAGFVAVRRVTAAVALLRLLVAGSLVAASALAAPLSLALSRTFLAFVALAVVAALFPRTHAVTVALLVVAALAGLAFGEPPLWRVLALATALYVAHSAAAFAAVLPYDCAVAPSALRRWAVRTSIVVLVSLGVGGGGLLVTRAVPLTPGVVGPIAGSLVATGIVALLAWQLRRR